MGRVFENDEYQERSKKHANIAKKEIKPGKILVLKLQNYRYQGDSKTNRRYSIN